LYAKTSGSFSDDKSQCDMCGKPSIIHDSTNGETFCKSCGIVWEQKIMDSSHDTKNYDLREDRRRVGTPISLAIHDFGLSTTIGKTNKDANGNLLSAHVNNTIKRIRIQDKRSQIHKNTDTSLRIAFETLNRIQDKIGVSDSTKELAAHIYRKSAKQKITQGRSLQAVVAASMYAACRNSNTLRTLRDISEAADIKRKKISQSYRAIVKQLDLKIPVVNQTHCILKISNNLGISARTKNLALDIIKKAEEVGLLAGRDPIGISAAAIYYACLLRKEIFSQSQVADASGTTAVTVRNRFHEIQKKVHLLP